MASEIGMPEREPRGTRRRPGEEPPRPQKIRPKSGLSRAEVRENQRARIFDAFATALAYHGYEDTRVADIIELAGVSRATFYEHFQGKEHCFEAAYADGVERLTVVVQAAASEGEWQARLSAGLRAGLEFLAAGPNLAHLLLVEALAAARPARLEYERSLDRLAEALAPPAGGSGGTSLSEQTARLLAGGLASHLSGQVLAGEAEHLPLLHPVLLEYLQAPYEAAELRAATG